MQIKFLEDNSIFEIEQLPFEFQDKVRIESSTLIPRNGGFEIIDGEMVYPYIEYSSIYDRDTEKHETTFIKDAKKYNVYFFFSPSSKYITDYRSSISLIKENVIFVKSGVTKDCVEPEPIQLYDKDGFYLYKVEDGKKVDTTPQDKKAFMEEKAKKEREEALSKKLDELSYFCKQSIEKGVDFNGSHFSYTLDAQTNISSAATLAVQTGLDVPYHADGESCKLFKKDEIVMLYVAQEQNLTHHTTYHNQLKLYTQSLSTAEEINAVKYGETQLPGKYMDTYKTVMGQASQVIAKFVGGGKT